jgi:hypothetical protein
MKLLKMTKTQMYYEEIKSDIDSLEDHMAELEAIYIEKHRIASRDGYIPQNFDEIGDAALRAIVTEDFTKKNRDQLTLLEALRNELEIVKRRMRKTEKAA